MLYEIKKVLSKNLEPPRNSISLLKLTEKVKEGNHENKSIV